MKQKLTEVTVYKDNSLQNLCKESSPRGFMVSYARAHVMAK